MELTIAMLVAAVLTAGAALALSHFGSRNIIRASADKIVDGLWDLRSRATTGLRNPCMDFPAADSVRLYSDTTARPDGYGAGDRLLGGFRLKGGVRILSVTGGIGSLHAACFESRGMMGSAGKPLLVTLGTDSLANDVRRVRLLPATGVAKVL